MSRHTEGEWILTEPVESDIAYRILCGGEKSENVIEVLRSSEESECTANAKLVAAAPKMLRALERVNVVVGDLFKMRKDETTNNRIDQDLLHINKILSEAIIATQ